MTVTTRLSVLTIALLAGFSTAGASQDLFLTNARIVDPAAGEVREGSLLIVDGVIAGSPNRPPAGFAVATVDLPG